MYTNKSKKIVLGEGETIGHKHVLESTSETLYDRVDGSTRIMLNDAGTLTHDEHDHMVFSAGKFRSYQQVELNPMNNTIGGVFD